MATTEVIDIIKKNDSGVTDGMKTKYINFINKCIDDFKIIHPDFDKENITICFNSIEYLKTKVLNHPSPITIRNYISLINRIDATIKILEPSTIEFLENLRLENNKKLTKTNSENNSQNSDNIEERDKDIQEVELYAKEIAIQTEVKNESKNYKEILINKKLYIENEIKKMNELLIKVNIGLEMIELCDNE